VGRLAVLVAVVTSSMLALGACGGGSKKEQAAAPTTVATAGTTQPVDTTFTGAGSADYCRLAQDYSQSSSKFNTPNTPDELRAVFQEAQSDIRSALAVAPPEIKADVQTIATGLDSIVKSMEAAGYDVSRLGATPPSLPPNFDAASQRIDAYTRDVCHLPG
jgi:ABC-type phosphate transport system substrate-binding protein